MKNRWCAGRHRRRASRHPGQGPATRSLGIIICGSATSPPTVRRRSRLPSWSAAFDETEAGKAKLRHLHRDHAARGGRSVCRQRRKLLAGAFSASIWANGAIVRARCVGQHLQCRQRLALPGVLDGCQGQPVSGRREKSDGIETLRQPQRSRVGVAAIMAGSIVARRRNITGMSRGTRDAPCPRRRLEGITRSIRKLKGLENGPAKCEPGPHVEHAGHALSGGRRNGHNYSNTYCFLFRVQARRTGKSPRAANTWIRHLVKSHISANPAGPKKSASNKPNVIRAHKSPSRS